MSQVTGMSGLLPWPEMGSRVPSNYFQGMTGDLEPGRREAADESDASFADILDISHGENPENGITGMLVRDGKSYFRRIEGRKETLAECVLRIAADRRHKTMTIVFSSQTDALFFEGWSLGEATLPLRKESWLVFKKYLLGLRMDKRIALIDEVCLGARPKG
jgi:hypothetical protein